MWEEGGYTSAALDKEKWEQLIDMVHGCGDWMLIGYSLDIHWMSIGYSDVHHIMAVPTGTLGGPHNGRASLRR